MIEPFLGHLPDVHESAWVHPRATLIGRVTLGADCSIWPHATLRGDEGDIVVGAGTNLQDSVTVHTYTDERTVIGARVTVGHNAVVHGATVEDECLIGIGAVLLDGARIGTGSVIAAGALVPPRSVIPPGSVVMGTPGRVIRPVGPRERREIDYGWQRYVHLARVYREGALSSGRARR